MDAVARRDAVSPSALRVDAEADARRDPAFELGCTRPGRLQPDAKRSRYDQYPSATPTYGARLGEDRDDGISSLR